MIEEFFRGNGDGHMPRPIAIAVAATMLSLCAVIFWLVLHHPNTHSRPINTSQSGTLSPFGDGPLFTPALSFAGRVAAGEIKPVRLFLVGALCGPDAPPCDLAALCNGGSDGARTRDLRRDRPCKI
jgi:hypothetical protein